jgi:hypothetical protein
MSDDWRWEVRSSKRVEGDGRREGVNSGRQK